MDSNVKKFLVKQKCKELMAFTSLEVRFLVDSKQLQQQTNAIVMMVPYFFE